MKAVVALLLILAPAVCGAGTISVGGVELDIPNPPGYGPVTPQMTVVYDLQRQFVAPTNEEFVAFIPEARRPAALRGEVPDLSRRFAVQTARSIIDVSASSRDFATLKDIIRTQNDEIMRKVEQRLPGMLSRINEDIARRYDVDLDLSVSSIIPLPVHEESRRTLAYSAFVEFDMQDASGDPAPYVGVVTTTIVHVRDKILFLYSYAEKAGLVWSRETSGRWARAVVAANPPGTRATSPAPDPAVAGRERRSSR